jgi:hypothetical protein
MAAPPITERHKHHFHRQSPVVESVRVATTANLTIATGLNPGDTVDGVTLADGDRVLVKDQSTGSENGIYVAGATPARAHDQSTADPGWGFLVHVREGTANGGKVYRSTNLALPTIGSTSLQFAEVSGGGGGGGVSTLAKSGDTPLTGAVTLSEGSNISLTQVGNDIEIAATAGGGGGAETGGYAIYPLDRTTDTGMDGTFGDDFTGGSLDAKWTRVGQTSGEESYAQGPRASSLRVAYSNAAAVRHIYQACALTSFTFEWSFSLYQATPTGTMLSLMILNSSGTGGGVILYDNGLAMYVVNITAGAYASQIGAQDGYQVNPYRTGVRTWLRLRLAAGVIYGSFSFDGENYSPELSGTPTAFTPARIGIGRILGANLKTTVDHHWFDRTA